MHPVRALMTPLEPAKKWPIEFDNPREACRLRQCWCWEGWRVQAWPQRLFGPEFNVVKVYNLQITLETRKE